MKNKTEIFIEKAKNFHKNKYDYSLVEYVGLDFKVKIICPVHGIFEQTPRCHLIGECFKCSKLKMLSNKEDFIKKAEKIHGQRYNYSLVEYKNSRSKIKIICNNCGRIFDQNAQNHLNGRGCIVCSNCQKKDTENFIKKAKEIHGNIYDYSLVDYKNRAEKIKIICSEHGIFEQLPYSHLRGSICWKCYNKTSCESAEDFISRSRKLHKDLYDYSLVNYENSTKKVKMICPIHGEFEQTPTSHLRGYGCRMCRNSKGETTITNILKEKNILFEREKKFNDCRDVLPLPFDFFLPIENKCIEFDGEQHFIVKNEWGGIKSFEKLKKHDEIKNIYCNNNDIKLYRISYKENIEQKLNEILIEN